MGWLWGTPMLILWLEYFRLKPFSQTANHGTPSLYWLALGSVACFVPLFLGAAYFRVSPNRSVRLLYERLGIRMFRRFATSGDLILRRVRRHAPGYRAIDSQPALEKYLDQSVTGERVHLCLFLLGLLSFALAIYLRWHVLALALCVGNVVANLYPCLLQRYNRARITTVRRRFQFKTPEHELQ
jgi:hypothetical protein